MTTERVLTDADHGRIYADFCAERESDPHIGDGILMLAVEAAVLAKVAVVLPGSYYMDPPDGGDVPIMEQLRRMAEDARGYREASAPGAVPVGEIRHRKGHPYAVLRRGYLPNGDTIPDGMPIYVVPPVPDPAGDPLVPEREAGSVHAECRECRECEHIGINDESSTNSTCSMCDWSGLSPKADRCPQCQRDGTMSSACPKCGGRYHLIADATLRAAGQPEPKP